MNDANPTPDVLNFPDSQKEGLPGSLNVLTILTYIGCALGIIFSIATPFLLKFSITMMDKASGMKSDMSDKQLADIANGRHAVEMAQQNMVPLMILGIVGVILCFIGAMWMRKLKKDGYWMYLAGEILPVLGGFIFMGKYQFADWKSYMGVIIPVIFILLYTAQRKYLIK